MKNKLGIEPLFDKIIVEPTEVKNQTEAGFMLPESVKNEAKRGTVLAVGPGLDGKPMTVKEGDTVLYGEYAATPINVDGRSVLIMREKDTFAKIEKE